MHMTLPPEISDILQNARVVSIPTRSDFRGISYRESMLFEGPAGWSEFSPFLEYGAAESSRWLMAAIEGAYVPWPNLERHRIKINATVPRISAAEVADFLGDFPGCTTIKMKVNDFESDADRVEAVLDAVPDALIRLDVNGGWSLDQARTHLFNYHHRFGNVFDYIEQPCLAAQDLRVLKSEIPFRIAADESIRKELDKDLGDLREIADVAIIKWAPLGGIAAAQKLIAEIGLPVVVSSALETGIGISHGLALAASLTNLDGACGLGTVALLAGDVVQPAVLPSAGEIVVQRVAPDPKSLTRFDAGAERSAWWENRVLEIWSDEFAQKLEAKGWLN
jgi:O-succinylbenzoate synthase